MAPPVLLWPYDIVKSVSPITQGYAFVANLTVPSPSTACFPDVAEDDYG